jgi:hypothetical protein
MKRMEKASGDKLRMVSIQGQRDGGAAVAPVAGAVSAPATVGAKEVAPA